MMRKLLIVFVLLLPLSQVTGQSAGGLLWEVTSPGGERSYLFGTMHSEDPRITRLPARIQQAFDSARSFTAEVKMDMETITVMARAMYLTDGRKLVNIIGKQRYNQCIPLLAKYGIPEQVANMMKPWAVATTLSLPVPESGTFLDLKLYNEAVAKGKTVYGLETAEEQMQAFDSMPEKAQLAMLDEALENYPALNEIFQQLVQAYLSRDLSQLENLYRQQMVTSDKGVRRHFESTVLIKRNYRMVERMQARLAEGDAFIAVGALHLPGNEGILNLLARKGYRVKAVY